MRAQPLKEGDVIPVPISDGGEVYNIEVIVGKREEIRRRRKVQRNSIERKVFDGRFIKTQRRNAGLPDDQTRVPLRARIKTQARQSQSI